MSGDHTRGITCPDMRRVVREALAHGWKWDGWTGTTHARITWPPTGEHLQFGSTPSVASWKSLASDIHRISGVVVWRKGNHKRSRKAVKPSGFSIEAAHRDQQQWHGVHGADVEALVTERADLVERCRELAQRRHNLRAIPPLLDRIAAIETRLLDLHQPVQPFDPYSLAQGA